MKTFVARQPILDRSNNTYGYELLFRNNFNRNTASLNNDLATADVLVNSFLNFDLDDLTNHTYYFINFTENLLLNHIPENFPPSKLVIEILETIYPSEEIIAACKYYKKLGYQIALDDYQLDENNPNSFQILPFVDIIKVDFRTTDEEMRKKIIKLKDFFQLRLLAEKVETEEEYQTALLEGFDYFQGYFFQKPVIFTQQEIPTLFHSYLLLIDETKKPEPNIDYLAKIIEGDLSISYKLLKLINNQYVKYHKIESIKQAIMLLGLNEFRRWLYILSLRDSKKNKDPLTENLISMSLVRGKFCELIAEQTNWKKESSSFFLTGMFSLIDSILHVSIHTVVKKLPLKDKIVDALLGENNDYRSVLNVIIAIEQADWTAIPNLLSQLNIHIDAVSEAYMKAIRWSNQLVTETSITLS